jgi:ATP-binding cassette, subfamily C, bacterial CydD
LKWGGAVVNRQLVREAKIAQLHIALTIGLGVGAGLLVIAQAVFLAHIVNAVFLQSKTLEQVWDWLLLLLMIMLLRSVFIYWGELAAHRIAATVKDTLRQRLLSHIMALGPHYARGERTGELVNLLTEGIEALDAYFARYLPQLAFAALIPVAMLAFVFPVDLTSGLILLLTAPLIPLFMWLIGRWAETVSQQRWSVLSRMSAHFFDMLQGLTTLKIFGRSNEQIEMVRLVSDQFRETTLGVLRVAFLSALSLELLTTLSTAIVAVTVGLRLIYDKILFEPAFFVLLLAPEFYIPLRLLGSQFHAGLSGTNAAKRMFEIFSTMPESQSIGEGASFPDKDGLAISFTDVWYAYEAGERPALHCVSVDIKAGERVALVGPSGAGKSTIAYLLLKFMKPDAGTIMINGVALDLVDAEQWRSKIAYVPQNPYLFYGSVADNIRMGCSDATCDDVVEAAVLAGAHQFIQQLPRGYNTMIGDGGLGVSGGQTQFIAIARAFLKNAPLLILDEATAGLDVHSEQAVIDAWVRLMENRTAVIIAHRLTTVYNADRILVLEQGRVVETGQHAELFHQQGVYYKLVTAFRGMS